MKLTILSRVALHCQHLVGVPLGYRQFISSGRTICLVSNRLEQWRIASLRRPRAHSRPTIPSAPSAVGSGRQIVTREQLRAALWPEDTFVDFEHGVNTAVKKVRQALEDSVDRPKFIETLPKYGYRFIMPVVWETNSADNNAPPAFAEPAPVPHRIRRSATGL